MSGNTEEDSEGTTTDTQGRRVDTKTTASRCQILHNRVTQQYREVDSLQRCPIIYAARNITEEAQIKLSRCQPILGYFFSLRVSNFSIPKILILELYILKFK